MAIINPFNTPLVQILWQPSAFICVLVCIILQVRICVCVRVLACTCACTHLCLYVCYVVTSGSLLFTFSVIGHFWTVKHQLALNQVRLTKLASRCHTFKFWQFTTIIYTLVPWWLPLQRSPDFLYVSIEALASQWLPLRLGSGQSLTSSTSRLWPITDSLVLLSSDW